MRLHKSSSCARLPTGFLVSPGRQVLPQLTVGLADLWQLERQELERELRSG